MNEILIDPEDAWLLKKYTWHITSGNYVACRLPVHRTYVYLHHAIMGCPIWYLDEIDHINRNPSDNRRSNLRWVTHSQNLVNNDQPTGQTGVRGITVNASGNYMAQAKRRGINHYLGSFETLEEAVAVRNQWLAQHGG